MTEVPDIVRFREREDLTTPGSAFEYIQRIASAVNEGDLSFTDKEFLNYISALEYELDYKEIIEADDPPDYTDIPDEASYKAYIGGVAEFKPTLISALLVFYIESGDLTRTEEFFYQVRGELETWESDSNQDVDEAEQENSEGIPENPESESDIDPNNAKSNLFPLLPYFSSRIAVGNPYNSAHPELDEILELARHAMEICDDHYLIQTNYARCVARVYEDDLSFSLNIENIPSTPESVINDAIEVIDVATAIGDNYSPAFAVKARLYALRGELENRDIDSNFESARNAIKTAIELEGDSDTGFSRRRQEYTRIQREIRLRDQTASVRKQVGEAADEVESLRENLEQTVDRHRRNTLSFIGFFAALITLAVTSIQILSGTSGTLSEKAILIIVQAGALIFAFGGFGLLLPSLRGSRSDSSSNPNLTYRALFLILLGVVVLVTTLLIIRGVIL